MQKLIYGKKRPMLRTEINEKFYLDCQINKICKKMLKGTDTREDCVNFLKLQYKLDKLT